MQGAIVNRIVWVVLIVSQLIYPFVPAREVAAERTVPAIFVTVLGAVAASQAIGLVVWFRLGAVGRVQSGRVDPGTTEGNAMLFQVLVLCWVLAESIAIYGLVVRFMGGTLVQWAPFAVAALVLMGVTNPFQTGLQPPLTSAERGRDATPIA